MTDTAVVLGAGGASRAVIYGMIERGIKTIHVVNRTPAKAEAAKTRFGSAVHPATWDDVPRLLEGAKLLINASSLGMKGQPDLKIDLSPMAANAVVADIVYVPLKTKLLVFDADGFNPQYDQFARLCQENNLTFIPGVDQYVRQAEAKGEVTRSDDGYHWNNLGNELVAAFLKKELDKELSGE